MRFLLALIVSMLLSACATNPVTGKRELSLMSEAAGNRDGARARPAGAAGDGPVRERRPAAVRAAISGWGSRERSQRPNLPWSFAVVDSPAVNAFALPGGFIYITRGILPYLDNEAQLVGVLGHEIGHVTARHSAQQYTRVDGRVAWRAGRQHLRAAGAPVHRSRPGRASACCS